MFLLTQLLGGNPAKEIRKRFPNDVIARLLKIKWWDWDIDRITKNVSNLTSESILEFLNNNENHL